VADAPRTAFDTIVVGLGAVGAATLLALARRGQRVLGIDRWNPPHAMGSTHGETRITRTAIGEGEIYVPLAQRSHDIWRELEAETGDELLVQCGALILGSGAGTQWVHGKPGFVRATIAAAERYAIPHEPMDAAAVMRRFPQIRLRGDEIACFEPSGGYVRPEACVAAQLAVARRLGAAIRPDTRVVAIDRDGAGAAVRLDDGTTLRAAEIVLAAGAWSPALLGGPLARHMQVTRQVLHWFAPDDPAEYAPGRFPVFIWAHGDGTEDSFYGFPVARGGQGVKVAMEQYSATLPTPDTVERTVTPAETAAMHRDHVANRLLRVAPRALRAAVCMYTITPDGDFLIDRAPGNDRVLLVSACSGHGFKHSAGLGEAVADTICTGTPGLAAFHRSRLEPTA
jgi:sarcosine oxidase